MVRPATKDVLPEEASPSQCTVVTKGLRKVEFRAVSIIDENIFPSVRFEDPANHKNNIFKYIYMNLGAEPISTNANVKSSMKIVNCSRQIVFLDYSN